MFNWLGTQAHAASSSGFDLSRLLRRLVVFLFALIQLVLVARILLDLGVIPEEGTLSELIIVYSDLLAAPVQGVGSGFGSWFAGGEIGAMAGEGFNPVMLVALAGWSVVEGLVMRVVRKFDQV
ncbi:MAG TPA: hypothetical protein VK969_01885 [Acidimicrobiia bacterium]|nr:hypothetical protein [Acidimicrobiia bacterium]